MKFLILLIILCSLCTVNSNGFDTCLGEIVGSSTRGNATLRGDFPFVCALYNVEHNSMFCEGTLVTARHILTGSWLSCMWLMIKAKKYAFLAAHCVQPKFVDVTLHAEDLLIYLGRYNLKLHYERGSLQEHVLDIKIHPNWNSSSDNYDADVAILITENQIKFSSYIRPVCFPAEGDNNFVGNSVPGTVVSKIYYVEIYIRG